jgi:predicted AAA+ superfamily ATPase
MVKRILYENLIKWKEQRVRKPLLLQGARQVGKTYLLKEFGSNEYENYAYFNFEETPDLKSLFSSTLDPKVIVELLSAFLGEKIRPNSTLIIMDEIQEFPRALTSLKYFCEQAPEYHITAAGSLLGVSVGKTSSFPVGKVNFMTLYPMSFFEYLISQGEKMLIDLVVKNTKWNSLPEVFHEKLLRFFKFYLFLGGMPEVVNNYIENQDIKTVRKIQKEILKAYERDFSKYTTASESIRISEVWLSIPSQLAKENKKFKYSDIIKGGRASRFESAIEWLRKAGLIYTVYNIKTAKLPLGGYADRGKFKLFMVDTGLLGAKLDISSQIIIEGNKLFSEYNGAFIENYVATELIRRGFEDLFYWSSNGEAEVDFVVTCNEKILPVEVKSGYSRKTKSLKIFSEKFNPKYRYRFSPRNYIQDNDFINIPLYGCGYFIRKDTKINNLS